MSNRRRRRRRASPRGALLGLLALAAGGVALWYVAQAVQWGDHGSEEFTATERQRLEDVLRRKGEGQAR